MIWLLINESLLSKELIVCICRLRYAIGVNIQTITLMSYKIVLSYLEKQDSSRIFTECAISFSSGVIPSSSFLP